MRLSAWLAASLLLLAACSIGETTYETVTYPARKQAQAAKTCDSPFATPDLATLRSCMDGKGHCWDKTKLPASDDLEPCDADTVCVPNKILTASGGKLKGCTFFLGDKPGACVGLAIPKLVEFKDTLKQDVCDEDERCVPCTNPEDGQPTPFCREIGVYDEPCTGGGVATSSPKTCCHGAGACVMADSLDADKREDLKRDQCSEQKLCVPAAQVDGKPVKCEVLGADGVCIDLCFAQMMNGASKAMRSDCGPTEICLPCAIGKGQGMIGCD